MFKVKKEHQDELVFNSKISFEVIQRAEIESISPQVARERLDIDFDIEGIGFKYYDFDGNEVGLRIRKDHVDKHGKYMQKSGFKLPLYFLKDQISKVMSTESPLIITEGEKKCLSIISNFDNRYAVIAIPGCWNFKDSDTSDIHEMIKEIPTKNRKVIFIGDSDFFLNPSVYNAYLCLIKYLYNSYAVVSFVDLRLKSVNEKVGADDFIISQGIDQFKERVENPFWKFRKFEYDYLDSIRKMTKSEAVDLVLRDTILEDDLVSLSEIYEALKEKLKINLGISQKCRRELLKKFNANEPKSSCVGSDIYHNPILDSTREISELIANKLAQHEDIYYEPVSNCFIEKNTFGESFKYISTSDELASVLGRLFNYHVIVINNEGNRAIVRQDHIPEKILSTIFSNPLSFANFKEVSFISKAPLFLNNMIISESGYHKVGKVYIDCDSIESRDDLFHLNKILDSFPFENKASKENALAFIMSQTLFLNEFIGSHPAVIISGDSPNLGKTTLAQVASIISNGDVISSSKFSLNNDDEIEKNIASQVQSSNVIIFDNVRAGASMISSSCLERAITDKIMSFRRLGKNSMIKRKNNLQFIFTLNGGSFSEDLLIRSLPIFLTEKSEQKLDFKFDVLEYSKKYRSEILGEMIGILIRWQNNGSKSVERFFPKFSKWASVLGGALEDSGYVNFLGNFENTLADLNPIISSIFNYCLQKMEIEKKSYVSITAGQVTGLHGVFDNADYVGLSEKSKQTKIGKLMKKLCGKKYQISYDDQIKSLFIEELSSVEGGSNRQYRVKDVTSVTSSNLVL